MTNPDARELGRRIAALERLIRDQGQADQADARAITDGSMDVYDDDGELRGRIGKQPDGGYGVKTFGKKPKTPTSPDVIPVAGGCVVEWDGTFEDAQEDDVQRIAIHVGSTPGFAINTDDDEDSDDDATEKAAILSPRGGSAFLALDPGETFYVRLTAVAEGGVESDPTGSVEVYSAAPEAKFWQDHYTLTGNGAQTVTLTRVPLPNSEHLYWNGLYQREDVSWTLINRTVSLLATGKAPTIGDVVVVEYAYLDEEEGEIPMAYGSTGWRYLLIPFADAVDRSDVAYDDSGFDVGDMAFGSFDGAPYLDWTYWPLNTAIWVRRKVIVDPGEVALSVTLNFDNYARFYWNGEELEYFEVPHNDERTFTIPAGKVLAGENHIAIRASDELATAGADGCHLDIKIDYA